MKLSVRLCPLCDKDMPVIGDLVCWTCLETKSYEVERFRKEREAEMLLSIKRDRIERHIDRCDRKNWGLE